MSTVEKHHLKKNPPNQQQKMFAECIIFPDEAGVPELHGHAGRTVIEELHTPEI